MEKLALKNDSKVEWFVFLALVALVVVSRLTSHIWNFTAVGGVALFSGAYFSKKYFAVLVPLMGLFISDLMIGLHNQMLPVYFSYALIVALGCTLQVNSPRVRTAMTSIAGACLFFLITNFTSWMGNAFYAQNFEGLMNSYLLGVPFFRAQFASDVVFSLVIFEAARQCMKAKSASPAAIEIK
ncbi:MAG: hypothetical protein H7256_04940 [Bdellovibrio sp.]|nr:hypothetical protein [Bdellovibrio sp.]